MIPVVVCFQFRTSFFITHARSCGQFVNIFFKIGINFFLTDTTDFGILVNHGNVTQVVQIAEHADLAELGHSRKQGKADASVHGFQSSIEGFQGAAVFVLQGFITDGL